MARILVVDDEPDLRFLLRRLLENVGFDVDEAGDGVAALAALREGEYALVIADDVMPRLSGRDLLAAIRDDAELSVRVVLWADNPEPALGADVVFVKPYGGPAIVERVRQLLEEND